MVKSFHFGVALILPMQELNFTPSRRTGIGSQTFIRLGLSVSLLHLQRDMKTTDYISNGYKHDDNCAPAKFAKVRIAHAISFKCVTK